MHPDLHEYHRFTGPARVEKALSTLTGLINGMAFDEGIGAQEVRFLHDWLEQNGDFAGKHPFNELFPVIVEALRDGVLTEEEREDILWLCGNLSNGSSYYDAITADLQQLHGILGGIIADRRITENELLSLQEWMTAREHLRSCWPYDELDTLITTVLADKVIDLQEHQMLMSFFAEFIHIDDISVLCSPVVKEKTSLSGLCAVCPDIRFPHSVFCFTGTSAVMPRRKLQQTVESLGGTALPRISEKVNYLIVCANGNPCWAYACYGRKIEQAIDLRRKGHRIMIVHENDFHDALEDARTVR